MSDKKCSFQRCDRAVKCRGVCETHHRQLLKGRPLTSIRSYAPIAYAPNGDIWCPHCLSFRHPSDFGLNIRKRSGLQSQCKECYHKVHLILKTETLLHYGEMCWCCGQDDVLFLSLGHKNNDGAIHRKANSSGAQFYRWLKQNGYPNDPPLRVECYNCNLGAAANRGVCPHKQPLIL